MLTIQNDRSIPFSPRLAQPARRIAGAEGRRLPSRLQMAAGRSTRNEDMSGQFGRRGSFFEVSSPERH